MSLINESGAVIDPSEISASDTPDDLPPVEMTEDEATVVLDSFSDIFTKSVDGVEDEENIEDIEELHVSLSQSLEQLCSIRQELQSNGCVSRSDATMIRNLMASAESIGSTFDKLPINSFTEMPSKVNFEASCESLLGSIYQTVLRIIKAVVNFLASTGKWLSKVFAARSVKNKQYDKVDAAVNKKATMAMATPMFVEKSGKVLTKYSSRWTALDARMVTQRLSDDTFGIDDFDAIGKGLYNLVVRYSQTLKASSPVALVELDYPISVLGRRGTTNDLIGRKRDITRLPNLLQSINEYYVEVRNESTTRIKEDLTLELCRSLMATPLMTFAAFEAPIEQVQAVAMISNGVINDIHNSIDKNVTATDEWLINRRELANRLKDIQLICKGITDIVTLGYTSRDKLSQIKLELVR